MSLGKRQSTDDEPAESASSEINLQTALDSSPWETLDIVGERRDNSCEECLSLYKGWVGKQYFLPYCSETLNESGKCMRCFLLHKSCVPPTENMKLLDEKIRWLTTEDFEEEQVHLRDYNDALEKEVCAAREKREKAKNSTTVQPREALAESDEAKLRRRNVEALESIATTLRLFREDYNKTHGLAPRKSEEDN